MAPIEPLSPDVQFHLLSHFNHPPPEYIRNLSEQLTIPIDMLDKQTRLPGSKFNSLFAETPLVLYDRIIGTSGSHWEIASATSEKTDYIIHFDSGAWARGIGDDQLIRLSDLDATAVASINLRPRNGLAVKTLAVPEMPATNQLVLVVAANGMVITAFPGKWLPPLDEEILKEWVFLVRE